MKLLLALLLIASPVAAQTANTSHTGMSVIYTERFYPPMEYLRWYRAAEKCMGMRGVFDMVRWYVTPQPWTDGLKHGADSIPDTTFAMWQNGHRITINKVEQMDSALVEHEAIHDILAWHPAWADSATHPKEFYGEGKCSAEFHEWHTPHE